ncbi:MAG: ribosome recycling factor [Gammaproteobacteria bacterium]
MASTDDIKKDASTRMGKSVETLRHELAKVRTGRAHASLLDHVTINYYGQEVPLNQAATVNAEDARTLAVTPWEKKMVPDVEKAIMNAGLGLNPVTSGEIVRVPLPALTEERRKEMIKVVRQEAEATRVAVRNVRRDANQHLKALIKDEALAKDAEHRAEAEIQKLTDSYIERVDAVLKEKEADLLSV